MCALRPLFLLSFCVLSWCQLQAQVVISGQVLDSVGSPVGNASVTYRELGKPTILGYTMSKPDGSFRLESKAAGDSIELVVSHLTYKKVQVTIPNSTSEHTVRLRAGTTELAEVNVAPFPIYRRKDTISYVVDAFTSKKDRVIGDIVRKLPGIEVINGRIYYQGKPIQKYMVNNLDLMEGRYGMINDNLPADAVKNVQVVENDQPIKVLDSLVASDRASLNLELKNPVTTTGTGRVGTGAGPLLWQLEFTPMVFGKSFQALASLQTNNVGHDATGSLRPFYTGGGLFRPTRDNGQGPAYLSVRNVSSPGFDESKWLDNRLFMGGANALQKLKDGLEIKGNVSYYNDRRIRRGFTATHVFAPDRTILLTEAVDNRYGINDLAGGVLVEKNEKQVYLRNRLSYHRRWNKDNGSLALNTLDDILQERSLDDYSVLNSLSLARLIGGQLVAIQSDTEFGETPQYLSVRPGQLIDALNGGVPYDRMQQRIDYRGLRTENSLSFVRKMGWWSVTPTLTVNYRSSRLQTDITTTASGLENRLGEGYINDMRAGRVELGAGARVDYNRGKWKLWGSLPYSFLLFNLEQRDTDVLRRAGRSIFNPSVWTSYALSSSQVLTANASYTQRFEEMDNAYNAYIATDYRSVQRYSAQLLGSRDLASGIGYRFDNIPKGVFANAEYTYTSRLQDYLFSTFVDSLGQSAAEIADENGVAGSHKLSVGYGRFFSAIKTTLKVRATGSTGQADYLLNGVLAKRRNRAAEASAEVNCSAWDFLGLQYRLDLGHSKTTLALGESNTVIYRHHVLQTSLHVSSRHSFSMQHAYYSNNMKGLAPQYFLDCAYTYHLQKWKTDIVLRGQNLLDNARYIQRFSDDYQVVETAFEMRPRQFVLSMGFRF